jgi:hypothetical protein
MRFENAMKLVELNGKYGKGKAVPIENITENKKFKDFKGKFLVLITLSHACSVQNVI